MKGGGADLEDERIIELFSARSESAIEAMDGKYGGLCRTLSRRITGSERDAEECVNDAYLGVWNTVPPERPSPLAAYLCKIVRNVSLKCRGRAGAEKRGGGCETAIHELEDCLTGSAGVDAELEARELARLIGEFLDTLSRENRVIFMRRYWFCDGYEEIAARAGLSVKNVSVRLVRLRGKLRDYLSERGVSV